VSPVWPGVFSVLLLMLFCIFFSISTKEAETLQSALPGYTDGRQLLLSARRRRTGRQVKKSRFPGKHCCTGPEKGGDSFLAGFSVRKANDNTLTKNGG